VGERASGRAGGRADGQAGGRMGARAFGNAKMDVGGAGAGGRADTGPFSSDPADEELFPSDPAYEERDDEGAPRYSEPATEAGREGG
jgi:hypothetical protein